MGAAVHADDLRTTATSLNTVCKQDAVINSFVSDSCLKLNSTKCEVLRISPYSHETTVVPIGNSNISTSDAAKCLGVWWNSSLSAKHSVMENISKARRAFVALGRLGAFQGDLNPLSSCSIFETCIIPALLYYGSETWLLDSSSLKALESFQHEIGCRILRVPKFYSKAAVRIGLHWPTVSSRILIRKLSFLSKLLAGSRDTISHRVFTSLAAMEDIFETSIVQQCRMLEANLNTSVLAECLTHPECAPDIVKRSKVNIINSDFKLLLTSAIEKCGSAAPAACIATQTSWRRLWDVALEKGIKGTRIMQMLFKELCRPMSCF